MARNDMWEKKNISTGCAWLSVLPKAAQRVGVSLILTTFVSPLGTVQPDPRFQHNGNRLLRVFGLITFSGERTFSASSPHSGLSFLFLLGRTQVRLIPLPYQVYGHRQIYFRPAEVPGMLTPGKNHKGKRLPAAGDDSSSPPVATPVSEIKLTAAKLIPLH